MISRAKAYVKTGLVPDDKDTILERKRFTIQRDNYHRKKERQE